MKNAGAEEEPRMSGHERSQSVTNGEIEFHGANVGGLMRIDDDNLRLGVLSTDGEEALLDVYLRADPDFRRVERVQHRSVFAAGDYRVEVVTLGEHDVAVNVAKEVRS